MISFRTLSGRRVNVSIQQRAFEDEDENEAPGGGKSRAGLGM
jgi:hypothetical protein